MNPLHSVSARQRWGSPAAQSGIPARHRGILPYIYGVTLRQRYSSDRYSDDGYLFLLWDFTDKSMPVIHVRTWQPASTVADGADVISIQDFNLQ